MTGSISAAGIFPLPLFRSAVKAAWISTITEILEQAEQGQAAAARPEGILERTRRADEGRWDPVLVFQVSCPAGKGAVPEAGRLTRDPAQEIPHPPKAARRADAGLADSATVFQVSRPAAEIAAPAAGQQSREALPVTPDSPQILPRLTRFDWPVAAPQRIPGAGQAPLRETQAAPAVGASKVATGRPSGMLPRTDQPQVRGTTGNAAARYWIGQGPPSEFGSEALRVRPFPQESSRAAQHEPVAARESGALSNPGGREGRLLVPLNRRQLLGRGEARRLAARVELAFRRAIDESPGEQNPRRLSAAVTEARQASRTGDPRVENRLGEELPKKPVPHPEGRIREAAPPLAPTSKIVAAGSPPQSAAAISGPLNANEYHAAPSGTLFSTWTNQGSGRNPNGVAVEIISQMNYPRSGLFRPETAPSEPGSRPVERVELFQLVERLAGRLRVLAEGADREALIELRPPELGRLRLVIAEREGGFSLKVLCEHAAVREMLQEALPQLQEQLERSGVRIEQALFLQEGENERGDRETPQKEEQQDQGARPTPDEAGEQDPGDFAGELAAGIYRALGRNT